MGEILSEKSGNLNLGVPGLMYIGGIASLMGAFYYENAVAEPNKLLCLLIALVFGFGAAFIGGLIYSFLTITLRANQNVTGLTLTIFGSGFGNFFGGSLNKLAGGAGQISVATTSSVFRAYIPKLAGLGNVGKIFFTYGWIVNLSLAIAIFCSWYLSRTAGA